MMNSRPIRVLVTDDSMLTRRVIAAALENAPDITVVGTAGNGPDCLASVEELRPDVVTLDVEMPGMNGLDVLRQLMRKRPTPVIMVSYLTKAGAEPTVRAMMDGAVDVVAKPGGPIMRDLAALRDELIRKVRAAARARPRILGRAAGPPPPNVPTVTRAPVRPAAAPPLPGRPPTAPTLPGRLPTLPTPPRAGGATPPARRSTGERFERLVVIGASTGGPQALQIVMANLVPDRTTAYLVVQHMPATMTGVLAELLDACSALAVREAQQDDRLEPGLALVAPGDFHVRLGPGGIVHLDQGPKVHYVRPSVDVALLSAAELYGSRTVAVVLTGIGSDGADGAVAVHAAGGSVIAEHESTCIVWGMPKIVAARGVADAVVPIHEIARAISSRLTEPARLRLPL